MRIEFREELDLPGWSEQSVWGYDTGTASYFAHLWSDGDPGDEPTIWIGGIDPVNNVDDLVTFIAEAISCPPSEVVAAIGPGPWTDEPLGRSLHRRRFLWRQ